MPHRLIKFPTKERRLIYGQIIDWTGSFTGVARATQIKMLHQKAVSALQPLKDTLIRECCRRAAISRTGIALEFSE